MGQGFLTVETQWVPGAPWVAGSAQGIVEVRDFGPGNAPPANQVALPAVILLIHGMHVGLIGFPMIWLRQLQVRRINIYPNLLHQLPFIYIPHSRRQPWEEMVPNLAQPAVLLRHLYYGGQGQNWRQIE